MYVEIHIFVLLCDQIYQNNLISFGYLILIMHVWVFEQ